MFKASNLNKFKMSKFLSPKLTQISNLNKGLEGTAVGRQSSDSHIDAVAKFMFLIENFN